MWWLLAAAPVPWWLASSGVEDNIIKCWMDSEQTRGDDGCNEVCSMKLRRWLMPGLSTQFLLKMIHWRADWVWPLVSTALYLVTRHCLVSAPVLECATPSSTLLLPLPQSCPAQDTNITHSTFVSSQHFGPCLVIEQNAASSTTKTITSTKQLGSCCQIQILLWKHFQNYIHFLFEQIRFPYTNPPPKLLL